MAWEARSGLKLRGIHLEVRGILWLNGLGSPFGIETSNKPCMRGLLIWLNGLGSPFGIETATDVGRSHAHVRAKWPGKPVRD